MSNKEISTKIYEQLYNPSYEEITSLFNEYVPLSDKTFAHPILHEIAHQAGSDPSAKGFSIEQKERFMKQNDVFKFIWTHPMMQLLRHNDIYRDTYKYTAIERLAVSYKYYCPEMKTFVKENICPDIDKVILIKNKYGDILELKNTECLKHML